VGRWHTLHALVKDDTNGLAMQIRTTRFGTLQLGADDVIRFPHGVLGMEACRQWVLLADSQNDAVGWLQSTDQPHVALAVVSPRRFVPGYQIRVARRDLQPLCLERISEAHVLVVVGSTQRSLTLNLKAPLVINLDKRLGCQVVAKDPHPLQYELSCQPEPLRKTA
jgi:flagellar assembly factor FliW